MRRSRSFPGLGIRWRSRDVPRAALLADLRRVARRLGTRSPTMRAYDAAGRYRAQTIARRFGSWTAALRAARLHVIRRWRVPEQALLANLDSVWRKLGRQPTWRELTSRGGLSLYAGATYKARFGSWHKALRAFERHVAGGRQPPAQGRPNRPSPRGPREPGWRLRATVLIRDNCLCRMCGASPAKDPAVTLHVDHVVPWSKGGRTVIENLQTLCERCNVGKGAAWSATRPGRLRR